jgi:hypothetical protein
MYGVSKEKGQRIDDIFNEAFKEPLKNLEEMTWMDFIDKYDKYSTRQFLHDSGISRPSIELIG